MRIGFQKEPLKLFNSGKVGTAIMDAANFGFSYLFFCLLSCSFFVSGEMARAFAIVIALCAAAHSQDYHQLPTGDGPVYYLQQNLNPLVDKADSILQYSSLPARLPVNGFG